MQGRNGLISRQKRGSLRHRGLGIPENQMPHQLQSPVLQLSQWRGKVHSRLRLNVLSLAGQGPVWWDVSIGTVHMGSETLPRQGVSSKGW